MLHELDRFQVLKLQNSFLKRRRFTAEGRNMWDFLNGMVAGFLWSGEEMRGCSSAFVGTR